MRRSHGIVTYDPARRSYLIGEIVGDYRFDPSIDDLDPNVRGVDWKGEVSRDLLSVAARNSLGSISTLFVVSPDAASELEEALKTHRPSSDSDIGDAKPTEDDLFRDIQERAVEFVKDRVTHLAWDELQELVAGLLRAMGYKTRVSPAGPDRGKDIIASPDGFRFEPPRIVVEVKHRPQTAMGSQEIRSFLGGRHVNDKVLYVSTGASPRRPRMRPSVPTSPSRS